MRNDGFETVIDAGHDMRLIVVGCGANRAERWASLNVGYDHLIEFRDSVGQMRMGRVSFDFAMRLREMPRAEAVRAIRTWVREVA